MPTSPPNLSIVIPAFNEGTNLSAVVDESLATLSRNQWAWPFEIVLVDDGSTDATGAIADELATAHPSVVACHHVSNRGFGAALKTGFARASGKFITSISADGEIALDDALELLRNIGDADMVASRRERTVPVHRTVLTFGWNTLVWLMSGVAPGDVSGIYVVRSSVLRRMHLQSNTGLVNLEVLLYCRAWNCQIRYGVMRVRPRLSGVSKVTNLPTTVRAFWEILHLRSALRRNVRPNDL